MADIDLQGIAPSAPQAGDMDVVRRGAAAPFNMALVPSITQEVIDARGDRMNLNNRITAISNVASPNAAGVVVGQYYDSSFHAGNASGAFTAFPNRFCAVPFFFSSRLRIDQLGLVVTTAGSTLFRCFIYSADPVTRAPDIPLFVGDLELDASTTGYKAHAIDFTFDADRLYWVGMNLSSESAVFRGTPSASAVNFGLTSDTATTFKTGFNKTGFTATAPLPDPIGVSLDDLISLGTNLPSIRMRAAAL